ncbi:peptidase S10, serine carboxypeptidase, Alpha/Beta hydrolase fold protein [Artemisia annua]|uniref:Peptidase S10, serine carboxypeptidase, Alpha/Beta hydrolase fold protein n=1 Tax=Artemisia annua TaxID=35608 RepID=A0A2U1KGH6_ARTAN|nr:peptidase S10, serine carboxypeptidase, Alpha/Beta hydrolase fold protein [Artemisia annua]
MLSYVMLVCIQWLVEHPWFISNPLYVTGISYMGILVPLVTLEVYEGNERGDEPQLNIKGSAILSPLTDKFSDFNSRLEFAHRVALISDDIYESAKETCSGNYVYNDLSNTLCANALQRVDEEAGEKFLNYWANDKEVQKALYVRKFHGYVNFRVQGASFARVVHIFQIIDVRFNMFSRLLMMLLYCFTLVNFVSLFLTSENGLYRFSCSPFFKLSEKLHLTYSEDLNDSGDHDMIFPYVGVEKWIRSLNIPVESPWNPWLVNDQVAGYRVTYTKDKYSLLYATVKGAGHSIPLYKPEETWVILDQWLASTIRKIKPGIRVLLESTNKASIKCRMRDASPSTLIRCRFMSMQRIESSDRMKSNHIMNLIFIIFVYLVTLSSSKSIVKTLPGFDGDLPFTLETGYIGLGDDNEIQFFYYFVESSRDPVNDPFLLYLTGGPGTSGLYPFLYQIGKHFWICPLSINFDASSWTNITLETNPYSWAKSYCIFGEMTNNFENLQTANVLFVDLPAGVGFSYATTYEASISSDSVLSVHSYEFLKKWLVEHPWFLNNPLYVTGISYMGILVPLVTLEVYEGNERGDEPQLNIKGSAIVSPLTDKFSDFNSRFEFAHRVALISDDIYESTKDACSGNYVYNDPSKTLCANALQRVDEEAAEKYLKYWANNKEVQKALYVREGTVEMFEKTNETIHYDLKKNDTIVYSYDIFSSIIYHQQLLTKNCQVLILSEKLHLTYSKDLNDSGDHDMNFPYVGTEKWIRSLNLPVASPWNPWLVNDQVAGYRVTYTKDRYSLLYATVKGAGHSIPLYKPEETWVILDQWLASTSNSLSDS